MNTNNFNEVADYLYNQCADDQLIDNITLGTKSLYKIPDLGTSGATKLRLAVYITHIFGCEYACLVRYGDSRFVEGLFRRLEKLIEVNTAHIPEMKELVLEVLREYHRLAIGKTFREISDMVSLSYADFLGVNDPSRQLSLAASNVFITIVETADRLITEFDRRQNEVVQIMDEKEICTLMKGYFAKRDFSAIKSLWLNSAQRRNMLKVNAYFAVTMRISHDDGLAYEALSSSINYYKAGYLLQHYDKNTLFEYALCQYNCTEIGEDTKNIDQEKILLHYSNALYYFWRSLELLRQNGLDDTDKNDFEAGLRSGFALQNSYIGDLCMKPLFDELFSRTFHAKTHFSRYHCAYISYGLIRMFIERVYKRFTGDPSELVLKQNLDNYLEDAKRRLKTSAQHAGEMDSNKLLIAQEGFNALFERLKYQSQNDPFFDQTFS